MSELLRPDTNEKAIVHAENSVTEPTTPTRRDGQGTSLWDDEPVLADRTWSGRLRKRKDLANEDASIPQRKMKSSRKTVTAATQTSLEGVVVFPRISDTTAALESSLEWDSYQELLIQDKIQFCNYEEVAETAVHIAAGATPGVEFLPTITMEQLETRNKPCLSQLSQPETKAVACLWRLEEYWVGLFWNKTENTVSVFFPESGHVDKIRISTAISTLYTLTGDIHIQDNVMWNGQHEQDNGRSGLQCVISLWQSIFELPELETTHGELWRRFFVALTEEDTIDLQVERILPPISRTRVINVEHQIESTSANTEAETIASRIAALRLVHEGREKEAVVVMENALQLRAITSGHVTRSVLDEDNVCIAKITQLDEWISHATPLVETSSLELLSEDAAAILSQSLAIAREQYQILRTVYQEMVEQADGHRRRLRAFAPSVDRLVGRARDQLALRREQSTIDGDVIANALRNYKYA
ncbi:hypothetical protein PG984_003460 [Apiospora sp. TS-2023a]